MHDNLRFCTRHARSLCKYHKGHPVIETVPCNAFRVVSMAKLHFTCQFKSHWILRWFLLCRTGNFDHLFISIQIWFLPPPHWPSDSYRGARLSCPQAIKLPRNMQDSSFSMISLLCLGIFQKFIKF